MHPHRGRLHARPYMVRLPIITSCLDPLVVFYFRGVCLNTLMKGVDSDMAQRLGCFFPSDAASKLQCSYCGLRALMAHGLYIIRQLGERFASQSEHNPLNA